MPQVCAVDMLRSDAGLAGNFNGPGMVRRGMARLQRVFGSAGAIVHLKDPEHLFHHFALGCRANVNFDGILEACGDRFIGHAGSRSCGSGDLTISA